MALIYSMLRGLPIYGGWALGESRWFFCSVLVPVGYLVYDRLLMRRVKMLLVLLALAHSIAAAYQMISGAGSSEGDTVTRFAGGRESLVVALGFLVTMHDIITTRRPARRSPWRVLLALYFVVVLVIIQTRSLYVFLPIIVAGYMLVTGRLNSKIVVRSLGAAVFGTLFLIGFTQVILPDEISSSITESVKVSLEGFSSKTLALLADPYDVGQSIADEYSKGGNTAFRLMAWSQVIVAIDETPYGWLVGMPMGAGFYFMDPSGYQYENLEPHNDYLSILSKVGLIGLLGYFIIIGSYGIRVFRHGKEGASAPLQMDSALLFSIIFLLSLFSSLNAEMRTYGVHFWLWLFLGMGIRCIESEKQETRK